MNTKQMSALICLVCFILLIIAVVSGGLAEVLRENIDSKVASKLFFAGLLSVLFIIAAILFRRRRLRRKKKNS